MNLGPALTYAGMGVLGAQQNALTQAAINDAKLRQQYQQVAIPYAIQQIKDQQAQNAFGNQFAAQQFNTQFGNPTAPQPGQPSVPMIQQPANQPAMGQAPAIPGAQPTAPGAGAQPPSGAGVQAPSGAGMSKEQYMQGMPQSAYPAFIQAIQNPQMGQQIHNLTEQMKQWAAQNPDATSEQKALAYQWYQGQVMQLAPKLDEYNLNAFKTFAEYNWKAEGLKKDLAGQEETHRHNVTMERIDATKAATAASKEAREAKAAAEGGDYGSQVATDIVTGESPRVYGKDRAIYNRDRNAFIKNLDIAPGALSQVQSVAKQARTVATGLTKNYDTLNVASETLEGALNRAGQLAQELGLTGNRMQNGLRVKQLQYLSDTNSPEYQKFNEYMKVLGDSARDYGTILQMGRGATVHGLKTAQDLFDPNIGVGVKSSIAGVKVASDQLRTYFESAINAENNRPINLLRKYAKNKAFVDQMYGTPQDTALPSGVGAPGGGMPTITTDAEYEALKSGTTFKAPDGTTRTKP
ncbi:MAG: hypothetical protein KGL63_13750 [Betaproteobacteria bacterium]|nr:hypothetical protein [Betaproteobacteria bacterium]